MWTAAGLQVLLGQPLELTPAIFAYSMLYPYTDNLLDDPQTSAEAKSAFNRRFRARLRGRIAAARGPSRTKVWALVDRSKASTTAHGIRTFIRACWRSRTLRRKASACGGKRVCRPMQVLHGVFAKGGTSVLADGIWRRGC